jgi:hypothetical protein
MRTLRLTLPYMRGEDVKTFQTRVTEKGFPCGAIDGLYGPKSYEACRAFQRANKLVVDGICGPKTWAMLLSSGGGDPLVAWGFSDMIQRKGRNYAIRQFQAAMGLVVDGIEGPKTKAALSGEVIVPRISEEEMRCQCEKYCDGYPVGHMSIGLRILAERIIREVEKDYPGASYFVTNRAHPTPNGAIAGGYRCERWNEERGGAKNSMHKSGIAMDLHGHKDGVSDAELLQALEDAALRINTKGGVGYGATYIVHIDTRGTKARWRY